MSPLQVYLILKLDTFINASMAIFIISMFTSLGMFLMIVLDAPIEDPKDIIVMKKYTIKVTIIGLLFGVIAVFTPTTKQAITMIIIPKIVNNEQVRDIPPKLLRILDNMLNEEDK